MSEHPTKDAGELAERGPEGVLVVDKPAGPTSHDVVDRVRRLYGTSKVGHAGTLDPAATGVLVLGLGRATRLMAFLQQLPKVYRAEVRFGVTTTTQDAQGDVVDERPCEFGPEELESAASSFVGEIVQLPPMASAVKVGGEPLYRAQRRGEEVERPTRTVRIYELRVERFDPHAPGEPNGPAAVLLVRCSTGTYVRTLAADLGERLGCGAHVGALRRLASGSFTEVEAAGLDRLEALSADERRGQLMSMRRAMRDFPAITVDGDDLRAVRNGQPIAGGAPPQRAGELSVLSRPRMGDVAPHEVGMTAGIPVGVLDPEGHLIAVYRRSRAGLRPAAVFP